MSFPREAVTKTVPLKFSGVELTFHLSHALFSSNRIDDGTMLLLKTLAQQNRIPARGRALDTGCGVGPLAVALAKHQSSLHVVARDRLALACEFTRENARMNHAVVNVETGLLLSSDDEPWDLIVSNLPAKAGEPVLREFFEHAPDLLTQDGWVCVVLVATLAELAVSVLKSTGAEIGHVEETPGYHVYHFRRGPGVAAKRHAAVFPGVYHRDTMTFTMGKSSFTQNTVYGLPNFDALDYRWKVSCEALATISWKRTSLLIWEPVQGHLATVLGGQLSARGSLHLAGNDLLALKASVQAGDDRWQMHCMATPEDLFARVGPVEAAVFQIHSEPEVAWVETMHAAILELLPTGAPVVINGTSTDLARFLETHKGLRKVRDEKYRGWRCVVFQRT